MTGRRHGSICAWLCATLLGVVLLCGTFHSVEARRRVPRDKKSYFKKADQIADIMGGRDPRPPSGWDDDSQAGGPSSSTKDNKDSKDTPIGGPAGQH